MILQVSCYGSVAVPIGVILVELGGRLLQPWEWSVGGEEYIVEMLFWVLFWSKSYNKYSFGRLPCRQKKSGWTYCSSTVSIFPSIIISFLLYHIVSYITICSSKWQTRCREIMLWKDQPWLFIWNNIVF